LKSKGITFELAEKMLPELIMHPQMDFESILTSMNFKKYSKKEILSKLPLLNEKFSEGKEIISNIKRKNWVMGKLRNIAIGNIELTDLSKEV
jgi:glutamyl-tRNA(Gln) amidotransferase subunit E